MKTWLKKKAEKIGKKTLGKIIGEEGSEEIWKELSEKNVQEWLDKEYPQNGTCLGEYDKSNEGKGRDKIEKLDFSRSYPNHGVSGHRKLEGDLILKGFTNLKTLNCNGNNLASLEIINCPNLEKLDISDNENFHQNLSFVSHLKKLKKLNIEGTNIESGLEYLPESLANLFCLTNKQNMEMHKTLLIKVENKVQRIVDELFLCGGNLNVWREIHPDLMVKSWGEEDWKNWKNNHDQFREMLVTTDTTGLLNKFKNSTQEEDYDFEKIKKYGEIYLRDIRPFSWETNELSSSKKLPLRLYNVKTKKIEETEGKEGRYAILSYVWGEKPADDPKNELSEEKMKELSRIFESSNIKFENNINRLLSYKAWFKAVEACEHLGIGYLWMDQLCINQNEKTTEEIKEMNQEVPKMRQYYRNSAVALISINNKVEGKKANLALKALGKIINSKWFTRSWTFQEGILPSQTIFMFDDKLIDGRTLVQVWMFVNGNLPLFQNLNESPAVYVTPLGRTYSINDEKASLGLIEALNTVKNRGRSISVDGIYSILGLLSYGEKAAVKYKKNICKDCKVKETEQKESIICNHSQELKTEWATYFKEDVEEALMNVMKLSKMETDKNNSFPEPLAWYGPRRSEPNWWIPRIDENGLINTDGDLGSFMNFVNGETKKIKLTKSGIELFGSQCVVGGYYDSQVFRDEYQWQLGIWKEAVEEMTTSDSINYLNERLCSSSSNYTEENGIGSVELLVDGMIVSLSGARETVEKISVGDVLVLPDREKWKFIPPKSGEKFFSEDNNWHGFAILMTNGHNRSIDVVRLTITEDILGTARKIQNKELFVDVVNKRVTENEEAIRKQSQQLQTQIEVSPKSTAAGF